MGRVLIIGCGGVASVAIQKCCQNSAVFQEILIASRTKAKCDALKQLLEGKTDTKITTAQALSGFDDHGGMSCVQGKLYGHGEL